MALSTDRLLEVQDLTYEGKHAEAERLWRKIGVDTGLLRAPRSRGRPPRLTLDELPILHSQAKWLIAEIREFDSHCRDFAREFQVTEDEAWAIRFPMLERELIDKARRPRLPRDGSFDGIADEFIEKRSGREKDTIRKIRYQAAGRPRVPKTHARRTFLDAFKRAAGLRPHHGKQRQRSVSKKKRGPV